MPFTTVKLKAVNLSGNKFSRFWTQSQKLELRSKTKFQIQCLNKLFKTWFFERTTFFITQHVHLVGGGGVWDGFKIKYEVKLLDYIDNVICLAMC